MPGKNIQVPQNFVTDVMRLMLCLEGIETNDTIKAICASLQAQIDEKLARMERREAFTQYKTAAPGTDEREARRKDYLRMAGIPTGWQSETEAIQ